VWHLNHILDLSQQQQQQQQQQQDSSSSRTHKTAA
jgi:hypothetical protein